jgi:hypothetical protein
MFLGLSVKKQARQAMYRLFASLTAASLTVDFFQGFRMLACIAGRVGFINLGFRVV